MAVVVVVVVVVVAYYLLLPTSRSSPKVVVDEVLEGGVDAEEPDDVRHALGRHRGGIAEMWRRYMGDTWAIHGRCRGDVGER